MKILAGIDGGGTRTRLALAQSDGTILGCAEGGCCSFVELGVPGATEAFRSLWQAAWAKVGQAPRPADAVFIGSGSILSEADEKTCESIAVSAGLACDGAVRARNDAWSALAGGLRGQPGILLIAGTGSACLGRNSAGQTWRAAGWGHLLHDGGSAYALGLGAMIAATRATDRRGPATSLTAIVMRTLELRDMTDIYRRVHHDGVARAGGIARSGGCSGGHRWRCGRAAIARNRRRSTGGGRRHRGAPTPPACTHDCAHGRSYRKRAALSPPLSRSPRYGAAGLHAGRRWPRSGFGFGPARA